MLVEEEGEQRTRDEKRSEDEEEVEVEEQREIDEGKWKREEMGSDVIEQMERETKSGVETQKARDEMEERKTPDSDKIMERYIDEVEYFGGEEEQSERDEEGENDCNLQNEVIEETVEREDSDGVREEEEVVEMHRGSSEEQRDEVDKSMSDGEGKLSLKLPEEDKGTNKDQQKTNKKVTKMSENEDGEFERLESIKENADTPLQQKGMLGEKMLPRCDRLPSEVHSVTLDPSPHPLMLFRCLQA